MKANFDNNAALAAQVEIIHDNPNMKSELLIDMKDIATIWDKIMKISRIVTIQK